MINFQLKEFIEKNIPGFDAQNPQDWVKAEKLLKAESRLNGTFSINEIEEFLDYLKNTDYTFDKILINHVISDIFNDRNPVGLYRKPNLNNISDEEINAFREVFSPKLKTFLSESIRHNKWNNLYEFQKNYNIFFNSENLEFYKNLLHEKCGLVIYGINHFENMEDFRKNYPFATNWKFYSILSHIDSFEFEDDVMAINSSVVDHQKTAMNNKIVLGEILTAMYYFNSENKEIKELLAKNANIGENWINQKTDFVNLIALKIANFFRTNKNTLLGFVTAIALIGLYIFSFVYINNHFGLFYLIGYFIINAICFFFYRKLSLTYFGFDKSKNIQEFSVKLASIISTTLIIGIPLLIVLTIFLSFVVKAIKGEISPYIVVFFGLFLLLKYVASSWK